MKDARTPPYFAISGEHADLADYLPDDQRLAFYDGIHRDYNHLRNGEPVTDYPHDMAGEITRKCQAKMIEAYDAYIRRANSNPTGKNQHSKPPPEAYTSEAEAYTSEVEANAYPDGGLDLNIINHNKSNRNKSYSINQIKGNLLRKGYRTEEIETAAIKAEGRKIRPSGMEKYLETVITNERQKRNGKTIAAQQYTQREYEPRTPEEEAKHADDMLDKLEELMGMTERETE